MFLKLKTLLNARRIRAMEQRHKELRGQLGMIEKELASLGNEISKRRGWFKHIPR